MLPSLKRRAERWFLDPYCGRACSCQNLFGKAPVSSSHKLAPRLQKIRCTKWFGTFQYLEGSKMVNRWRFQNGLTWSVLWVQKPASMTAIRWSMGILDEGGVGGGVAKTEDSVKV